MAERRTLEQVSAAELAPLEAVLHPSYPERLREMATVIYLALQDHGQDLPAHDLALALTEAVSLGLGGGSFYMHKGFVHRRRLDIRDREIARSFNGRNHHLLAKKHNLSDMRIRQIVDAWQEEQYLAKQDELPGMPPRDAGKPPSAAPKK